MDLGCGDAALGRALIPKGLNVISFDLVSDDPAVVEADICTRLPLPGSEQEGGLACDDRCRSMRFELDEHKLGWVYQGGVAGSTNWVREMKCRGVET